MRSIYYLLFGFIVLSIAFALLAAELQPNQQLLQHNDNAKLSVNKVFAFNALPGKSIDDSITHGNGFQLPITSSPNSTSSSILRSTLAAAVRDSNMSFWSAFRWNRSDGNTTPVGSEQSSAAITNIATAIPKTERIQFFRTNEEISSAMALSDDSHQPAWIFLGTPNVDDMDYPAVGQIVVDSEDERLLYVMVYQAGLFISRDGGLSWELAVPGEPPGYGVIAKDRSNVNRVFYGQHNKLYVSTDRGLTWNLLFTFDPSYYCESIAVSQLDPHTIFVCHSGSNVRFYRSDDDGVSWQSYSYGQSIGIENFRTWAVGEDPIDGTLYVGIELGNHPQPYHPPFLRSTDGGMTWENLVENMASYYEGPIWHVTSIAVHPYNHKVYALSEGVGVYTSIDHGLTWTLTLYPDLIGGLFRDPNREGRLFAGSVSYSTRPGGAYISTDDAETFSPYGLEGLTVSSFALADRSYTLYATAYGSGIYFTWLPYERQRSMPRSRRNKELHRSTQQ